MSKKLQLRLLSIPAVLASAGAAHAAVPAAVTTAITDAGADLVTVVTAVVVAFVAFWGMRKLGQKFGWV